MHFSASYPTITLDTIANFATYTLGQPPKGKSPKEQSPKFRGNQSHALLTLILDKFYWRCKKNIFQGGNPFYARTQASHASLADTLGITREWTCKLIARLREGKWIETYAPRKPNGKYQEVTTFRPGGKLKRLLVRLKKSHQRPENHIISTVNDTTQQVPTSKIPPHEVEKNLQFLRDLQEKLTQQSDLKKKIGW